MKPSYTRVAARFLHRRAAYNGPLSREVEEIQQGIGQTASKWRMTGEDTVVGYGFRFPRDDGDVDELVEALEVHFRNRSAEYPAVGAFRRVEWRENGSLAVLSFD